MTAASCNLLQYRAIMDYKNPAWVVPRMADKMLFGTLILTLYLGIGDDFSKVWQVSVHVYTSQMHECSHMMAQTDLHPCFLAFAFQPNLTNLAASLFMWCALPAFASAGYSPSIVLERRLFYRERADGCYLVVTYLVYKLISELILAAFISLVFAAAVFYGVDYQGSFLLFWYAW
jgi:hypothetical protein